MKKRTNFSEAEIEQIKELVPQRYSTLRIGRVLGRDAETIRRKMVSLGIPRGPRNWKGELSTAWAGGRSIDKSGYVMIYCPGHPHARSGKYVAEHRLVMEKILGRYLSPREVVHHKDKDLQNNDPANLCLYTSNGVHLKNELKGKVPRWTKKGLENIAKGHRNMRGKHFPQMSAAAKARPPRPKGKNGQYAPVTDAA